MELLDPESSYGILLSSNAMQMENACKSESDESKAIEYIPCLKGVKLNAGLCSCSFPCGYQGKRLKKLLINSNKCKIRLMNLVYRLKSTWRKSSSLSAK